MSWLSRLFRKKSIEQKASIIVLGASGAGKTTLVRYLETGEPVEEDPREAWLHRLGRCHRGQQGRAARGETHQGRRQPDSEAAEGPRRVAG